MTALKSKYVLHWVVEVKKEKDDFSFKPYFEEHFQHFNDLKQLKKASLFLENKENVIEISLYHLLASAKNKRSINNG